MSRFCNLIVLGVLSYLGCASAQIELPDLPYGQADLEPHISNEVSHHEGDNNERAR